jgi:hypothetical protein
MQDLENKLYQTVGVALTPMSLAPDSYSIALDLFS